jgi:hypothetical protein
VTYWPAKPFLYEINTHVWLNTLSQRYNQPITLRNVPDEALDEIAGYGLDAVWLMGVWERSPRGLKQARQYIHEYRAALPDITEADIVGSAYAIHDYRVDKRIGGKSGLAGLRQRLADHGLRLILDYVPNHMGLDHPWVCDSPGLLMQGIPRDLKRRPRDFYAAEDAWGRPLVVAHGRDPYFPGWSDTAQVNAFNPDFRRIACDLLLGIASQCDGVRCDMAMLMVNRVFAHTWNGYFPEDEVPQVEFWEEIIPRVKAAYPDFLFIGEVYWNMEHELQTQGFDYTYDKLLYDRLSNAAPRDVRVHLVADIAYQRRLVRFIENHDEPRAYQRLGAEKTKPAAVLIATVPGMALWHDGQFTGRRAKLPVHINRQPDEPVDHSLAAFYRQLMVETRSPIYQHGKWRLFNLFPAWSSNITYDNMVAHGWVHEDEYRLIIVNLSGIRSQALVHLGAWHSIAERQWRLDDTLNGHSYVRSGDEMVNPGLFVDLEPYKSHVFRFVPA